MIPPRRMRWREPSVLPGFAPAFGFTLAYLAVVVLAPLSALVLRPWEDGAATFLSTLADPRVHAAMRLSFGLGLLAAAINTVFGLLIAWVLVRYRFPGRRWLDALVDLPFALPTAVAGLALTALYAPNGWLGEPLMRLGVKVAYTPLGILVALVFVGIPFVVRTVQPVLQDFEAEVEEAAETLGATALQRAWRVVLPSLQPALLAGFALAFARGVGEYGSVIFIAGNMPMRSEIAPLLIVVRLEQFDYAGAAAVGLIMLLVSFGILFAINFLQFQLSKRSGG